jgi:ribosomal protein L11 methyltransferase
MVVRIEVPRDDAEVAADLLWQAGATAVGEAVAAGGDAVELTADLDDCPPEVAARWPASTWVDDGAWRDGWRPFARAVRAGPFLVRPPWVEAGPPATGVIELVLDGGHAFGTGSHPSTTLALEALAALAPGGASVLDVGCGSGALAIGAALLGAARVVAVDIDPAALEATSANVARNGVGHRVDVSSTAVADVEGTFDVVLANLGSPLVVDLADVLLARTAPAGALVLGGLLEARAPAVAAAYPMTVVDLRAADGWANLVLAR